VSVAQSIDKKKDIIPRLNEVSRIETKYDTLKIVTTDNFAYFPFGRFNNLNSLISKQPYFNISKKIFHPYNDSETDTLYNLKYLESKITLIYDREQKLFQITSGIIVDEKIRFENDIRIGDSKNSLLEKFIPKKPSNSGSINVIEIISALTGIWHYYTLKNNILVSVELVTDYQIKQ